MSNQSNNQEEVDLIQLFEYFKRGIKSFFRKIAELFHQLFYFLYLLKKNWYILLIAMFAFAAQEIYKSIFVKKEKTHNYEMVIRTNYENNYEIYSSIHQKSSNNFLDELGLPDSEKENILSMAIEPAGSLKNEIIFYQETVGERISSDSAFFDKYILEELGEKFQEIDLKRQKININTRKPIELRNLEEEILNYFNSKPNLIKKRDYNLSALEVKEKRITQNLSLIDSLLLGYSEGAKTNSPMPDRLLMSSMKTENSAEIDLLKQADFLLEELIKVQKKKEETKEIVGLVSSLKEVKSGSKITENKIIKKAVYGLLFGALIVFLLQANKYLNQKFKKNQIKN